MKFMVTSVQRDERGVLSREKGLHEKKAVATVRMSAAEGSFAASLEGVFPADVQLEEGKVYDVVFTEHLGPVAAKPE